MNPVMPDYVQAARSDAGKLGKVAADYAASSFTIPDELKKVVQEALDYNKDVIGMRSQAFNDWSKSPADANVKFGVDKFTAGPQARDRKSTRLNSSHSDRSRMPSSA